MTEYVVDFGGKKSSAFVRLAMAQAESNGARLCEEIVRCRDCTYGTHFFHHDDERWQCANPYQDGDDVKPDAYCWRGKRKDSGDGE